MAEPGGSNVTLWVGGAIHQGWTSVSVTLNLDHLSGSFSLGLTDDYLRDGALIRHPIRGGVACRVEVDGEVVITGHIDKVSPSYGPTRHEVTIAGRDRTGDLLDCSARVAEHLHQPIASIIAALAAPFGIGVSLACDPGAPFDRFAPNPGDSVADCIERLCRQRAVLAWSDGLGNLVIGRGAIGRPVAVLRRGATVEEASAEHAFDGRYSEITVMGSREGADDLAAADIAQVRAVAFDRAIIRHRPLILIPETQGETTTLAVRANHEVRVRAGKGLRVNATVTGWRHGGGLWRPGQTVTFHDDWLGVAGDYLVSNVTLTKDEGGGSKAVLTLYPPGAFDLLAREVG